MQSCTMQTEIKLSFEQKIFKMLHVFDAEQSVQIKRLS